MPRYSNYWATIKNGDVWTGGNYQFPPHELDLDQISLSYEEYNFLRGVKSIKRAKELIEMLEFKIGELDETSQISK